MQLGLSNGTGINLKQSIAKPYDYLECDFQALGAPTERSSYSVIDFAKIAKACGVAE